MSSTLAGQFGRVYVRKSILKSNSKNPELDIYLAHYKDEPFVLKPTSQSIFELSQELKHEFGSNRRLRTHIDDNQEQSVLIYEYHKDNLLSLVRRCPNLPFKARKFILREVAHALRDLHQEHWIHLGVYMKPDNVMINWSLNPDGHFKIDRVVLSDLDCALKLKNSKLLDYRIGNVMWRSPEGQAGKGIGKPSEVFSFGLLCLYTITGAETLHPDFRQLEEEGTEAEHVILYKLLSMFGPVPRELITHVNDTYWTELLRALSQVVAEEDSSVRFINWDESGFPNLDNDTKKMILRMTNLDPMKRATMDQILADPWWC